MKVFVINLKRSEDRRKRISLHLKKRGIEFELVEAVDGQKLSDEDMGLFADMEAVRKHPNWLTRGTIGACLSHYKIYKRVVEEGLDGACILEDDIVLNEDFAQLLTKLEPAVKENKFIMLYYTSWNKMELKPDTPLQGLYGLYKMENLEGLNSAAGYVISKEQCRTMMDFVLPIRNGADSWTEFARHGAVQNVHCVYPQPASLAYAKSTIDYLQTGSLKAKLSDFINDYKVFPVYQLFKIRRKMLIGKMSNIQIVK